MAQPYYFGEYLDLPPITENVTKVRRLLGIRPTPFDDGLRETYRWYTRQKHAKPDFAFEERLLERFRIKEAGD